MPLYEDLVRRALEAKARSEDVHRSSSRIVELTQMLREARAGQIAICRCAWCERFRIGDEWLHLDAVGAGQQQITHSLLRRSTHGICPDCYRAQISRRETLA